MSANKVFINDLDRPQLTETQQQALAFTSNMNIHLAVHNILADAQRKTGLTDFGNAEFIRRLQLLCEEWETDSGLSPLGKLTLCSKLVLSARNRLLIQDLLLRHPEIHDIEIRQPIIICGLPDSGASHLLNLLAADKRLSSLPLWEANEPLPLPNETADYRHPPNDPRYQRCLKQWQNTRHMTPLLATMQPMHPDHIHEELELMGPDFASGYFESLAHSPHWRDDYYQHDQTPHYEYMQTVLKILQWQHQQTSGIHTDNPTNRWVLGSAQHLEQLPVLHRIFPDATLVMVHRDPVAVIQSTITRLAYGQRIHRKHVTLQELLHYWTDRIEHSLRTCLQDRQQLPQAICIDIPAQQWAADHLGTLQHIYQQARLAITPLAEQQLSAFIQQSSAEQDPVQYQLKKDFGIEPTVLRQRFQFYFDAFTIHAEN